MHNFVFAAFGNCRIRDKDESDVQKLCEDIDHCLILAASIAVMASAAEQHCSKERRHPHKQVCTLGCFARNVIQNCLGVLTIYFWFKLKQISVLFSLLWAAGAWSMNMESSWECWMPPINGLKGFCCCNCRMYSWWGGHYSSWAVWDKRSSLAVGADLVLSCDTLTRDSNGGYSKVRNHREGPY